MSRPPHQRAVIVGINYDRSDAPLRGCINDAVRMERLWRGKLRIGSEDIRVLTDGDERGDDAPTKRGILENLRWLVDDAQDGDLLLFHFSGYAARLPDPDDTDDDGFLECLVPVDYQRGDWGSNFVTDEEINAIVGSLPAGATLIMQIDAGIKGNLVNSLVTRRLGKKTRGRAKVESTPRFLAAPEEVEKAISAIRAKTSIRGHRKPRKSAGEGEATVVLIAAGHENQSAADTEEDGENVGAMTRALEVVIRETGLDVTFEELLKAMAPMTNKKYLQDPRLATFLSEHKDLPYADFDRSGAAPVSSSSRPARDRAPAPAPARATTSTAPPVAAVEAAPAPAKPAAAPSTDRPGTERDYSRDDDRYHDEDSYRRGGASGTRQAVGGDDGPAAGDVMRETFRNARSRRGPVETGVVSPWSKRGGARGASEEEAVDEETLANAGKRWSARNSRGDPVYIDGNSPWTSRGGGDPADNYGGSPWTYRDDRDDVINNTTLNSSGNQSYTDRYSDQGGSGYSRGRSPSFDDDVAAAAAAAASKEPGREREVVVLAEKTPSPPRSAAGQAVGGNAPLAASTPIGYSPPSAPPAADAGVGVRVITAGALYSPPAASSPAAAQPSSQPRRSAYSPPTSALPAAASPPAPAPVSSEAAQPSPGVVYVTSSNSNIGGGGGVPGSYYAEQSVTLPSDGFQPVGYPAQVGAAAVVGPATTVSTPTTTVVTSGYGLPSAYGSTFGTPVAATGFMTGGVYGNMGGGGGAYTSVSASGGAYASAIPSTTVSYLGAGGTTFVGGTAYAAPVSAVGSPFVPGGYGSPWAGGTPSRSRSRRARSRSHKGRSIYGGAVAINPMVGVGGGVGGGGGGHHRSRRHGHHGHGHHGHGHHGHGHGHHGHRRHRARSHKY